MPQGATPIPVLPFSPTSGFSSIADQYRAKQEADERAKANDPLELRRQVLGDGDWNMPKLAMVFGPDDASPIMGATDRELAFRDAYGRVVNGSNTAKINEGVKATKIRSLSPGAGSTDIALGGALGGGAGAATAAAAKTGRAGWNVVGQPFDKARNRQLAEALLKTGPEGNALVARMDSVIANRATAEAVTPQANMLAQSLMQPADRDSENRERAKALGRCLAGR